MKRQIGLAEIFAAQSAVLGMCRTEGRRIVVDGPRPGATGIQIMNTEQPTLEQIRLKIRELRAEASRLFQAGEIERAAKLLNHAVRLEDLIAPSHVEKS